MSWAAPLRLAVALGLPPETFWRLSLREWRALTEAPTASALNPAGLRDLLDRYPDEEIR